MDGRLVSEAWLKRYLSLLGVEREPPGRAALARLVRAQGEFGVFENVTAILRRARVPTGPLPAVDLDALLSARADGRGGGVCFELTPLFRRLLLGLGYQVQPILAQISFPGSHHASVVDIDGAQLLVDIGGGAPLWRPFPLQEEVEIRHAGLGYRLRPDGPGAHLQERLIDGEWQPFCRYDLRPAGAAAREVAYQRHHAAGETWVVGNLTLVRCTREAVHRLRDDELVTHTADGKQTERIVGGAGFRRVVAEVFGLPALPVEAALVALEEIRRVRR
ncbi:MAG: arylamine N-acetyltransferase [Chloroflexota bacterium]|nr:arylamine N-acetyltransferase [Chloroflexota bacterium]